MLLDNRNLGLLASSIKKATNTEEFIKTHGEENKEKIKMELKKSLVREVEPIDMKESDEPDYEI